MKKSMLVLLLTILIPGLCLAAPFLVSDPQDGVTHYELTFEGQAAQEISAQADGRLKYDLAGVSVGDNSVVVKAVKYSELWGRQPSDPVPFFFTRPAPPLSPTGLGLSVN